ncbi:hypothetical protein F2Q68_00045943 [Brassica cretica]|uniref:Uncharacterized protein n=2 Tax=Brassica cretica TaxID=69181 RepID=A0A8S9LM27_BRACR|nr:hypothetical protein F2Q68_00045943 [Brassica cretica]KAF3517538.1 hypothetical protein DY000_02063107 [Brassica cretica]
MSFGEFSLIDYDPLSSQGRLDSAPIPAVQFDVEDLQSKQVNHSSLPSSPKHLTWKSIGPVEVNSLSSDPSLYLLNKWSESLAQSSLLASEETLQVASKLSNDSLIPVSEPYSSNFSL